MPPEEITDILLHNVPNCWETKFYLQGRNFEGKTYKETCEMFDTMEIAGKVYKGVTPSKNTTMADDNHASNGSNTKVSRIRIANPHQEGMRCQPQENYAAYTTDPLTGGKTCLLHGPGHS